MRILVINVGSTSLKFKLFLMPGEETLAAGRIEGIGQPESRFRYTVPGKPDIEGDATFRGYSEGIEHMLSHLLSSKCGALASLNDLAAIGFKTVLAKNIVDAVALDDSVLEAMEEMAFIAPSHNPPYVAAIRSFRTRLPGTPLIGLFEPAFHKTVPEYAWRYAVPYDWVERFGIRRYGFHGASHRYAAERTAQMLGRDNLRLISCHLGGSSSINATLGTRSLDNSFGLTPQSGLIQSNRPGDIDAFIPIFLIEHAGMSPAEVRTALGSESGLKGMSGVGSEMKDVLRAADEGNPRARLTIDAYVYQARKWIGAATVVLGGVDVIVFTGGIGERSADLREQICDGIDFLGITLDPEANRLLTPDSDVARKESAARILLIEANEELIVARACVETLAGPS